MIPETRAYRSLSKDRINDVIIIVPFASGSQRRHRPTHGSSGFPLHIRSRSTTRTCENSEKRGTRVSRERFVAAACSRWFAPAPCGSISRKDRDCSVARARMRTIAAAPTLLHTYVLINIYNSTSIYISMDPYI